MNWSQLYHTLGSMFDTDGCLQEVKNIWENDRWFSRDKFNLTAAYCAETMEKAGLTVEKLPLKADGKTKYFDWKMPIGWDAEKAILMYADGEVIADYSIMPCQLVMYCPSTPGMVEGEVMVPDMADPDREKYRGKILFVSDAVSKWTSFADETGALGVISDITRLFPGIRNSREDLYDECMWMVMSSSAKCFGMHLTPRQADELRCRMALGPVRLCAEIKTRTYEGISYTVAGDLVGTQPELPAVLAYGHLYEPGANDNASGTGAILYLARLLGEAVRDGRLPRPRRTIRFMMGDECWGSMGYLACHPEKKHLCGIVSDMIGTEKGDNAVMALCYDPVSNWSFADAALYALAEIAREQSGDFTSESSNIGAGTDNIISDPCFSMPAVALVASPALSYHSSMDRPDRIEPETLRRNALITGTYLWGIANADAETRDFLAEKICRQIGEQSENAHPRRAQFLQQARQRALHSLNLLGGDYPPPVETVEPMPDYAGAAGSRVPERIVLGALNFAGEYNGRKLRAAWNGDYMVVTCWADGKRSLWEIAYLSAMEKNKCTDEEIREEFAFVSDYFSALAEKGYIRWR